MKPVLCNIGRNIVICKKYVIGVRETFYLIISMIILEISELIAFILFNNSFFPFYIYIIVGVLLLLNLIFYIITFLTEPGIIPRNHPDFIKKESIEDNKENKDINESKENKVNKEINNDNLSQNNNLIDNNINSKNNLIVNVNINSNNDNEELRINNSKNVSNNNKDEKTKPRIFTERECSTCKIIRPPGASHCSTCNNCVLNFDHHCVFISSCVGKRNHKYFFIFLFFGSITSLYIIICQLITIIKVFILEPKGLYTQLWDNNKWASLICLILIALGIICLMCSITIGSIILLSAYIMFIVIFYIYYKREENQKYYNPFIILVLGGAFFFFVSVVGQFCVQNCNICRGVTVKQSKSIKDALNNKEKLNDVYIRHKTCGESIKNFCTFLFDDIPESLIVPERDLFPNKN